MKVIQIPLLRDNYAYLLICEETKEAAVVDPSEAAPVLRKAEDEGVNIGAILNTHHHWDHTGGNPALLERMPLEVHGYRGDRGRIHGLSRPLDEGDEVTVGELRGEVIFIPGHTKGHIAYHFPGKLFCGDTLFNAGVGNCHNGGHPAELYDTFAGQLSRLPDHTLIYPGHDYLENNLSFTLDREPDNTKAARLLDDVGGQDLNDALVSTLAMEKEVNTFFRLHSPSVIARLRDAFPGLPDDPDPKTVFLKLRELRNSW